VSSNFKLGVSAMQAACDAIVDLVDPGGPGLLKIYSGSPPATPATGATGTLLATLTFSATAFGSANSSGTATANSITSDTNADASADAGYFRVVTAGGTVIFQGTAGNSGDSPDMTFDNKSIVAGGTVACSAMTLTVPTQ
jgi:hypothetical protein